MSVERAIKLGDDIQTVITEGRYSNEEILEALTLHIAATLAGIPVDGPKGKVFREVIGLQVLMGLERRIRASFRLVDSMPDATLKTYAKPHAMDQAERKAGL